MAQSSLDTFRVGDYVRRFGRYFNMLGQPDEPQSAICHVTDPDGCVRIHTSEHGNVVKYTEKGTFYWHMIASQVGDWAIRWLWKDRMLALPDQTTWFRVEEDGSVQAEGKPGKMPILRDGDLELHPLRREHLELVRCWRNTARLMFFQQDIVSPEQQQRWYRTVYLEDPTDLMWVAFWQGRAVGTGALNHIDMEHKQGEWSRLMIGEDWARGKGIANRIAALVRDYGLDALGLERIYGSLWTENRVTMHVDIKAGYMPYKVEGAITFVELLRKDWRK